MDNFVIGTIQENIKTLSSELQVLNSNTPSKLSDLSDVSAVTPADGDTLVYNATDDIFEPKAQSGGSGGSSITELDDIPGVTILNVQNNQFLKYDSGEWINSNITDNDTDNLSDLTDTLLTTPFGNDEVLKYLNGKWVNGNIPIEKLSNVYISNLQDGETLRYVQQNTRWENVNNIDTLNELSDVTVSSNLNNQVLKYNNSLGVYKNDFLNLTDLGDTNITTLANGNILIYNNGVWSAGNITYTNGTGVSITDNKIIIGQSVGTTDDVQFAEVICDEISTNTISERTTGGGITITGSVNMTGIPESANSNKLLYNIITGQITHQADTGGNGGGADDLTDLTDTAITTPQNNQVLKYLDGKWRNLDEGVIFNGLPYGSFALRDETPTQTFVEDTATSTRYDHVIIMNKMTLYDTNAVEITSNLVSDTNQMLYFGVQTTTDYILNWTGVLAGSKSVWAAMTLEDSEGEVVQKSVGSVVYRNTGVVEGFATFQIMAKLEAGKKYTIKIETHGQESSSSEWPKSEEESPWQFNLQVYAIGSGTEGAAAAVPMPLNVKLPSDNALSLDLTLATITGTDVIINENIIGTVTGTEVTVHPDTGLSTTPNGYVKLANPITWTQDFTIEIYFKGLSNPNDLNSEQDTNPLFSSNDEEEDTNSIIIDRKGVTNGARFIMEIGGQASGIETSSSIPGFDGEFGHLVLTHSSTDGRKMYSNGTLVTTTHVGGVVYDFSSDVLWPHSYLGSAPQRGTAYWDTGDETIRTFRIYNRVLTASEIKTLADDRDLHVSNDVTNYTLVSGNADGTETKWVSAAAVTGGGSGTDNLVDLIDTEIITPRDNQVLKYLNGKWKNMEVGSVGVPAPPVISTEFALPANVLADYDFRTYTLSGANVIDSDGDVIFTTIGSGNISFTSAEGVYTSSDPDRYLSKSDGLLPIPSGNFSLEFYIKFGPITTNVDHVFFQYNAGADITLEGFIGQDGKLYFQTRNGPNNLRLVYFDPFDTEATLANWDSTNFNHFVITWDGSGTEKLYHDGSLVTKNLTQYSGNVSYGQNLTFATLYLGGAFPGVPRDNIDDTIKFHRLYDGALSPADVSYLFDNREVSGVFKDVTNYALVSNNATGTETRWLSVVPAPTVIPITDFTLPTNMLANYDFRTYTLSGTDVIDSNGSVIGTTVGNGVELSSDNGLSTTSTSHISLNPISWTQDFTIEIYFKCPTLSDAPSQDFNPIFSSYLSADQNNEIVIDRNGITEGARFYMHINGSFLSGIVSTGSVAGFNGTFGHLVCTHSSTNGRQMYVNGFLQSTTIVSGAYYNFGSDQAWNYTFLGVAPYRPTPYIDNGIESIKNFKIFNKVLTQDEVYTLYTNRDEIYGQTGTVKDVTNYSLVSNNADGTETRWVSAATAGTAGTAGTVCKIHILPFTDDETADVNSNTYTDTVSKTFTKTTGTNLFGEVHINYTIDGSGADSFQARLKFSDNPSITGDDYDIAYYGYIGGGGGGGDINGVAAYTDGTGTSNAGSQGIYLQARCIDSGDTITFKNGFFKVTEIWA